MIFLFSFLLVCVHSFVQRSLDINGEIKTGISLAKIHDAGTALLLVSAVFYYWFQTIISYHAVKVSLNSKCMFVFRLAVSCTMTLTGIAYPFFKWYSDTKFSGDTAHWKPSDGGYALHVVNCAGEWVACLCLALYAASFYKEFQTFSIGVCGNGINELRRGNNGYFTQIISSKDEDDE